MSVLSSLLAFLLVYKYFALFVVVFSVAVIVPLPVNAFLLAAGAFASLGYLNLVITVIVAVVGNVLGDVIDYFLARHYGPIIFSKFNVKIPTYFKRLEEGVHTHARLTVFITRFVGPLDLIVNFLSGLVGIPPATFIFFDFLGNFICTFTVIYTGYLAGNYWQNFSSIVDIAGTILLVVILIFILYKIFIQRKSNPI